MFLPCMVMSVETLSHSAGDDGADRGLVAFSVSLSDVLSVLEVCRPPFIDMQGVLMPSFPLGK